LNTSGLVSGTQQEKKYLIEGTWWRQWSSYVNFEASSPKGAKKAQKEFSEQLMQSQERINILKRMHEEMNKQAHNEKGRGGPGVYSKPGIIKNGDLLEDVKLLSLKENLMEPFDFVSVSCEVWSHLYSWYSADHTLVRFMKRDRLKRRNFILDLYPPKEKYRGKFDDERESELGESESEQDS